MSLLTRDYDYELPDDLLARWPLARREDSRMMVLNRAKQSIEHKSFTDFASYLRDGDLVVLNDTKVIPARAFSDDGKIELLFLEQQHDENVEHRVRAVGNSMFDVGCSMFKTTWK